VVVHFLSSNIFLKRSKTFGNKKDVRSTFRKFTQVREVGGGREKTEERVTVTGKRTRGGSDLREGCML